MTRPHLSIRRAALLGFVVLILVWPAAYAGEKAQPYRQVPPSRDGIGKLCMGREISQVMGHRGDNRRLW